MHEWPQWRTTLHRLEVVAEGSYGPGVTSADCEHTLPALRRRKSALSPKWTFVLYPHRIASPVGRADCGHSRLSQIALFLKQKRAKLFVSCSCVKRRSSFALAVYSIKKSDTPVGPKARFIIRFHWNPPAVEGC